MKKLREKSAEKVWADFEKKEGLTGVQLGMFKKYATVLHDWNKTMNLTAIKDLSGVIRQHFRDSLVLRKFVNLSKTYTLVDIGTGAGFPAIPLKIIFPDIPMFLIEVNKKKIKFLNFIIQELDLHEIQIVDLDWRTFLRKTSAEVDLFVTRAAIGDVELCRMFKPASSYNNATLVYWAAIDWQPHPKIKQFVKDIQEYKIGKKQRKLVFLKKD
jgi:16S rRNA (guanine(527)-N(7))-methyltransferase RsmG